MLGLGRALGETMAVTVIGNANRLSGSLFAPALIASTLANEFAGFARKTSGIVRTRTILFMITFVVLAAAKWLTERGTRAQGR
jgi:ABC-type phosphate transport system permease subunit